MILKNGTTWDNPLIYTADSTNSNQWGNISSHKEIRNSAGQWFSRISSTSITQTPEVVTFDIELLFNTNISAGAYPDGSYQMNSIVFDQHMLLAGNILDQYYMIKNCKSGGWNIDLIRPTFNEGAFGTDPNPRERIILARQLFLDWEIGDASSGVSNVVINAYSSSTDKPLRLLEPTGQGPISLEPVPPEAEIGIMTDSNTWKVLSSPPRSTFKSSARIDIGENEEGMATFYVTGFDQACNDTLGSETINLNPWITAKGGLVYSGGSVGINAKDVTGQASYLASMLKRVAVSELDIATELVSSRSDYINNFIHSNLGAVRAHSTYNSNSKKSFWFNYLTKRLQEQIASSGLIFTRRANVGEGAMKSVCSRGDNCYIQRNGDVTIPSGFTCDRNTLVIVDGNIHIEPDLTNGGENNIKGCIFVASGNITIGAGQWKSLYKTGPEQIQYDYIDAFMVAENIIDIQLVDVRDPGGDLAYMRDGLEIHGGLVALGKDTSAGESAVQVNRSLALLNNLLPTVVTSWDPRYAKLSEIFFGTNSVMYKQEVGFKPY